MQLAAKVAVITGASGALGRALCKRLACDESMRVWATDINAAALSEVEKDVRQQGGEITTATLDVRDELAQRQLRDQIIAAEGHIDLWINNAGIAGLGSFSELTPREFEDVIDINLRGVVLGTRCALWHMQDRAKGCIVNIASVAGHVPAPYMSAYVAAKHGVVGFTRSVQMELEFGHSPVALLLVSPGFFASAMLASHGKIQFPAWLRWCLSTPEKVAHQTVQAIKQGQREIIPDLNGKLMKNLHQLFPVTARRSSKILLAKSFKDLLLNRFDI